MTTGVNLSLLPRAAVIEELSYEAIVARQRTKFQELWEAVRIANPDLNLPTYDVGMLESDPVMIIIESESYRELLLRARVNDAARANLLSYSAGTDLDNLAADHGVTRLVGETDSALRERIVLADQGRSTAGPEDWYAYHARSADVRVKDVKVYRTGTGPELGVAILSTEAGGVPSAPVLAAVTAAVNASAVRSINDVLTVASAVTVTVNVAADIWLLPDTPETILSEIEPALRASAESEGGIGFDINRSWLIAKLSPAGVSRVELSLPSANVTMPPNSAAVIGTVTLTYRGRSR